MKDVLVLVQDYPNNEGGVSLMYVHTRNLAYKNNNINVTVLNFNSKSNYFIDGIRVITESEYRKSNVNYSTLILHAANIRNHYRFLKKYGNKFSNFIFFYHGHEILIRNEVYPKPYQFVGNNYFKNAIDNLYDIIKVKIRSKYLISVSHKSEFVFVSNWMKEQFFKWTKIQPSYIKNKTNVIYNSVGQEFENNVYDVDCRKKYDFITIRTWLDGSKYCIDVVNKLATNTPNANFLIIGKGDYFKHNIISDNITLINTTISHSEIIEYLNKSRFALMPTRCDAQGLMMCEMAAFGIPIITSQIDVCREVFGDFNNAYFIDNNNTDDLNMFLDIDNKLKKDKIIIDVKSIFKSKGIREDKSFVYWSL